MYYIAYMEIEILYTSNESLEPILEKYNEFIYTFVFEEQHKAFTKIIDEAPLAFQMANKVIKDIQLNEGIFPTFKITYDNMVYLSTENDLKVLRSMFLNYITFEGINVTFSDIDFTKIKSPLLKYLYDDFDMGFVYDSGDDGIIEYNFESYNADNRSITIDVSNGEKINLVIDSEDITFDDILSISKAIYLKKMFG